MKKLWRSLFKETEFSSTVFSAGIIWLEVMLWFLLKKYVVGYYFWQDKIHDGGLLHYIYMAAGILNIWIVSDRCRNKSLF